MRAVKWSFGDDNEVFSGFTNDTRWNGFLNIWVDEQTWQKVAPSLIANLIADGDTEEAAALDHKMPDENGLYSLAYGYTTDELPSTETLLMVHYMHCDQGEFVGSCKYGDDDCPALLAREKAPNWMVFPGD